MNWAAIHAALITSLTLLNQPLESNFDNHLSVVAFVSVQAEKETIRKWLQRKEFYKGRLYKKGMTLHYLVGEEGQAA